jgi:hypothetical protein
MVAAERDDAAVGALRRRDVSLLLISLATTSGAFAQQLPAAGTAAASAAPPPFDTSLLKTGLFMIAGGGCNTLLRFSQIGLVLVDVKLPGTYRALRSQIRRISRISDLPVRVAVLTDHQPAHAGNAPDFLAAGVAFIVHRNAGPHLAPPEGKPARIVTYDADYTLRMGGVEVRIVHPGRAQTDDCAVVLFPDMRVIAVGDLYTADGPKLNYAAGGSLLEWGPSLAAVLALDFDAVIPGEGPPVTRAALLEFKSKIETLALRATALYRQGVGKPDFVDRLDAADLGWKLDLSGEQLDRCYAELAGST